MANLRIISITVSDNSHILCKFTHSLSKSLTIENILIVSETPGIETPSILGIDILNDTLTIRCQQLIQQAAYTITFLSTIEVPFVSLNEDAVLVNDTVSNSRLIFGVMDADNPIKNSIVNLYKNNVYELEQGSIVSKYIDGISLALSRALYNIGQTKNDNYLSFTVKDELKVRGDGAYDRLNQEGAYELIRVGFDPTNTSKTSSISILDFPPYPISLQSEEVVESLTTNNIDLSGSLNLKTLIINCSKFPVIKLNSVVFIYNSILTPFTYNIDSLGYQVNNSKYDPDHAFTYLTLNNNQFKLNDAVLLDASFSLENIASIQISYQYKNNGIIIDETSLNSISILSSGREVLPPLENIFSLKNAPIIKANNKDGSIGDVLFIDPNAAPGTNTKHPSFLYEIKYRLEQLPSRVGEYSIDYTSGKVYVYGNNNEIGTGAYPPLAIYSYRHTYQNDIDYVYDTSLSDIVALPDGNLITSSSIITFNYERALINGVDYISELHKEELSERIENRLIALNAIKPSNFPITNVFRIFNETSGEIYNVSRWTNDKVFFTYNTAPRIISNKFEKALFDKVNNETLFINATVPMSPVSLTKHYFKIVLLNNNIISNSDDGIANPKNTSVEFSEASTFITEFYYDEELTEDQNKLRLTNIGDYSIDYKNGVIWILVSTSQDLSIGTISYKRGYINVQNKHITSIEDLYYKINYLGDKTRSFDYISFDDKLILPSLFDDTAEKFLNGDTFPYQISSNKIGVFDNASFVPGVKDYIKYIRGLFERNDFLYNVNPINFSTSAIFTDKTITANSMTYNEYHTVEQDGYGFFITTNTDLEYLSANINRSATVIRLSDSADLWGGLGTFQIGSPFKLRLPGTNSPVIGQSVLITYTYTINDLSRVIVDYSRGDYLVDYSNLADEIILSYEYGDNVINFAKSTSVEAGNNYYVSYKCGALRDALLRNFGTLIDIPILNNLNVDFERERYRDALMAAMQSFTTGPTVSSLKNIVKHIVHTQPEIIESAFQSWDLGSSILSLEKIKVFGNPKLLPAKYGNGILMDNEGDAVSFPIVSNLRIEEGTMEMWVTPQWNGIDNQAELTITIHINGFEIIDTDVFLGPGENHPKITDSSFSIKNINNELFGTPNKNKDGIYIYLAPDSSGAFNRWYLDIVDNGLGADSIVANELEILINTDGVLYDVKMTPDSITTVGKLSSGTNSIKYKINSPTYINEGITFSSDYEHYLFDMGEHNNAFLKSNTFTDSLTNEYYEQLITEDGDNLIL